MTDIEINERITEMRLKLDREQSPEVVALFKGIMAKKSLRLRWLQRSERSTDN